MREEVPKLSVRSRRCSQVQGQPHAAMAYRPNRAEIRLNQHEAVDAAAPDAAAWDLRHHLHASQQPEGRDRTPPIHPMAATSGLRAAAALRGLCPANASRGGAGR